MTQIVIWVPGIARPGGSKTARLIRRKGGEIVYKNGQPIIAMQDAGKHNKEWRATIALFARQVYQGPLLSCALDVRFEFFALRPQDHYRGNDRARGLKPNAPRHVKKAPDVLKLARAAEDALTGVIWTDDCITVDLHASKRFGEEPGCRITIQAAADESPVSAGETADSLPLFDDSPAITTFMEAAR